VISTRIRIVCVADTLGLGGSSNVLLAQLGGLPSDRFELGLLTLADDLDTFGYLVPDHVAAMGVRYRADHSYGVGAYLSDGLLLHAAKKCGGAALDQIDGFAPDILHFHTNPRELGLGILANRRAATQLVFTDHSARIRPSDYSPQARFLLRLSYRRLYRQCHVISVGPVVERLNRSAGFMASSKEHLLLENEIDLLRFSPPAGSRPEEPLDIIYVGRIHPGKGVDTLIRAFARLSLNRRLRLLLVGPDMMDGAAQALAAECIRLPLETHFLGARGDIPSLLQGACVGVLVSRREGLPVALLEQMATALPVVVSDIPELTDVVSDGATGLVVPLDDVDALARAIDTLVRDPILRTRLGQAAREMVVRRAEPNPIDRLATFYETVAAGAD
jgi:glycosyltransferase involved in cell wall biosynthesis